MKKLLTALTCLMLSVMAFGQWEMLKGPETKGFVPDDAIALDATTIVAVVDNIVMRTTDFGENWTEITLDEDINLTEVDYYGSTLYASADDGIVFKSVDAGVTWVNVKDTVLAFDLDLNKISVVDENNVFVAADAGYVLYTNDGGTSWDTTHVGTGDDLNGGIAFSTALNGVAFCNGSGDAIYTTHDGGVTWAETGGAWPVGLSTRQYDATALAPNVIMVAGYHNIIWKTVDGGDTWTLSSDYTYAYDRLIAIKSIDENTALALNSASVILKTEDAGVTWDTLTIGSAQTGKALAFSSATNGWVWSDNNQVFKTTDGVTFEPTYEWPAITFYSIDFAGENELVVTATSGGELTKSTDGGMTWSYPTNAATGATSSVYDVNFIDTEIGFACGSAGLILKTTDGGDTWEAKDNPLVEMNNKTIYFTYQAPNGDIYAGGSSAYLLKSTDVGETWSFVPVNSGMTIYAMQVLSNGKAFLAGNSGRWCMSTTTALDSFDQVVDMGSMSFRQPKERNGIILVPANDDIYKLDTTLDTLISVFTIPDGNDAYALEWVSDSTAFFVGSKGSIYRTDNAGVTWEQETSAADDYLYDLKFDGEKLWVVGKYAVIMSRDVTDLVATKVVPEKYELSQNYPNPFNPVTTLEFQVPNKNMVNVSVYNLTGHKVASLVNKQLDAGFYSLNFDASALPSGIYLYRLTAGNYSSVKKMTLLK